MATTESALNPRISALRDAVARAVAGHGIRKQEKSGGPAVLSVKLEQGVRREIKAYWTPFVADIPGPVVSLNLEIREPKLWWSECYLSPDYRNWVFCFSTRPDGDVQLTYYADYATPAEALEGFFDHSGWYLLTPADKDWTEIVYEVEEGLGWDHLETTTVSFPDHAAIQESIKKSTIIWLRWKDYEDGIERTMPVWFLNDKGTIYVLSGERQQTIPHVEGLKLCDVIFRLKGKNARVGEVPASVRLLEKGPGWDEIAEKIAEKRLNIPGLPEATAKRWRDTCEILELTLIG